jgi:single-strand DNA-binding protein
MAKNMNQWIGEGNISCDPELRHTFDSTRPVTNFNLYVDNVYRSKKDNDYEDEVAFKKRTSKIPVVAWAGKAEMISKNFRKGDKVRLVGHLRTRKIEKNGVFFNAFEIVVEDISLIRRASSKTRELD